MSRRRHQIEAHFEQGRRLFAAGRPAEAEQVFRAVLAADPHHADSLHMLGLVAAQAGHPQPALALIEQAIRTKPSTALFHANHGNVLLNLGRAEEARASAEEALRHKRNCAEALLVLGHAFSDLGHPAQAVAAYAEAVRQNPRLPDLHNSLGLALRESNRLEDAAAALQDAVQREPNVTQLRSNLAGVLKDLGRLLEAEAIYRDLLRARPDDAVAHYNLGVLLLVAGRLEEAWPEWEWRFRAEPGLARPLELPAWQGEALDGRTLLVRAEQGIGDMIQFCRYLALIPPGGQVALEVHAPLVRLLSQLPSVARVVALGDTLPPADVSCHMMSLPHLLATGGRIPSENPYLHAPPDDAARWASRVAELRGLRVGLAWAGNPERFRMDRRRSIGFDRLTPLLDVPDVAFVSLQKGGAAALRAHPLGERVHDWSDELTDFADTAGLVAQLDLVIAVDTAVVHLAGAMGKPVWLLNRADTCWRWLLGRTDSAWYPTLRQFRQASAGAWEPVVAEVRQALALRADPLNPGPMGSYGSSGTR